MPLDDFDMFCNYMIVYIKQSHVEGAHFEIHKHKGLFIAFMDHLNFCFTKSLAMNRAHHQAVCHRVG